MLFDRSEDMIGHCITLRQRIYLQWGGISTTVQPPSCFQPDPNLPLVFYPTQISTRPKPHSCFRPDPNLFTVFDASQTSFPFSTRPKPLSCFRRESNLLPVFYPTQTSFLFSTQVKRPSRFLPDPNLPETDQQERKTNQQTHQTKRKIYNPNSGLQTAANKTIKQEKLSRTTDE